MKTKEALMTAKLRSKPSMGVRAKLPDPSAVVGIDEVVPSPMKGAVSSKPSEILKAAKMASPMGASAGDMPVRERIEGDVTLGPTSVKGEGYAPIKKYLKKKGQ